MPSPRVPSSRFLLLALPLLVAGCDGEECCDAPRFEIARAAGQPESQLVTPGSAVAVAPAVLVTRNGSPAAGAHVTFRGTAGSRLTDSVVTTDTDGIARLGRWRTLTSGGPEFTVEATVNGAPPVRFTATATDSCPRAVDYTVLASVAGALEPIDCFLVLDSTYADYYRVEVASARGLALRQTSTSIDALLYVFDADGILVGGNDDVADGDLNAEVRMHLGPGRYSVVATSYDFDDTGPYAFGSVEGAASDLCRQNVFVTAGASAAAALNANDCTGQDATGTYYGDFYLVRVRRGVTLTATMRSTAMNAKLELYTLDGSFAAQDDNGAGGTDARVAYPSPLDQFYVLIATTATPAQSGAYTLDVSMTGGSAARTMAARAATPATPAMRRASATGRLGRFTMPAAAKRR